MRFSTDTITSLRGVRHEPSISFNTLIIVCRTVDVYLLLVLLNLLLQTTEFLTENHRAAGACLCVCVCQAASLPVCIFSGSYTGTHVCVYIQ